MPHHIINKTKIGRCVKYYRYPASHDLPRSYSLTLFQATWHNNNHSITMQGITAFYVYKLGPKTSHWNFRISFVNTQQNVGHQSKLQLTCATGTLQNSAKRYQTQRRTTIQKIQQKATVTTTTIVVLIHFLLTG